MLESDYQSCYLSDKLVHGHMDHGQIGSRTNWFTDKLYMDKLPRTKGMIPLFWLVCWLFTRKDSGSISDLGNFYNDFLFPLKNGMILLSEKVGLAIENPSKKLDT